MVTISGTMCLLLWGSCLLAQEASPSVVVAASRTNYPIRVIPAPTGTNFSIVKVAPAPGTNYTIRYVYP